MPSQFKLRRDTAANWTSVNPTLADGEPGFERDTGRLKIGNGSSTWSALTYASLGYTGSAGSLGYTGSAGSTGPIGYTGSKGDSLENGVAINTITYSGTISIDTTAGSVFKVAATGNPTISLTGTHGSLAKAITLYFEHSGAARVITWGGTNIDWTDGVAPSISTVSGAVDVFTFTTYDGGTKWKGSLAWWSNT